MSSSETEQFTLYEYALTRQYEYAQQYLTLWNSEAIIVLHQITRSWYTGH